MHTDAVNTHLDQLSALVADAAADPAIAALMTRLSGLSGEEMRKLEREIGLYERTGLCTSRIRAFLEVARPRDVGVA